jgi:RNA binding activity-knot of a chromodomain
MGKPLRFSLAALVGVILLVSVYLAALRQSSTWAVELALTLTIGVLTAGLLWALFSPNANRWFWLGFQLAGWGYLLLAFSDWSQAQLKTHLITTRLVTGLHQQMPIANPQDVTVEWHGYWYPAEILRQSGAKHFIHYRGYGPEWDEWIGPERIRGQLGPFLSISHSLLSLVLALAGGVIGGCLGAATRSRRWFWIAWCGCLSAAVAISIWAVASDSEIAASAALSLLLLVLLMAALAAWNGLAGERAFALGFAIVGCGYFLLHFGPGLETAIGQNLLSTRVLQQVQDWLHPSPATPVSAAWTAGPTPSYRAILLSGTYIGPSYPTGQPMSTCMLAGHSLLAILLSLLGGVAALWMSRRRPADAKSE